MCTVTYLPLGNKDFILTSNRDEDVNRKTISPKIYTEENVKLIYPKDELAGGTWIGLSEKNRLVCLLNGAFTSHIRQISYKMSRGIIVKKLLITENGLEFINTFDFNEIEPFTIIYIDWSKDLKAYELIWDGKIKHFAELNQEPKIWSSSSLYSNEMKQKRQDWFTDWLNEHKDYKQNDVFDFHQQEKENTDFALKMKRSYVETVSITSVKKYSEKVVMKYKDFKTGAIEKIGFNIMQK